MQSLRKPLVWCLLGVAWCGTVRAEEGTFTRLLNQAGRIRIENGRVSLMRQPAPVQPLDIAPSPNQPLDLGTAPTPVQPTDIGESLSPNLEFNSLSELVIQDEQLREQIRNTPAAEATSGDRATITGSIDAGGLLQQSPQIQTVSVKRRSAIALDPYIRGYSVNQIYTEAEGAWIPVRQDLDSILGKIDPSLIQDLVVIPGPYGLRYGPGLVFINTSYLDTPRYENGYEAHNRIGLTYRANGDQWFGRDTIYGGNSDYGYIVNYGNRTGIDYQAGNGQPIPASYHAQTFFGQFGFDLTEDSKIDFRYQRLDQTETEYAAQFFDVNFLVTDSFTVSYVSEDPCDCSRWELESWYNRTRFAGDTELGAKRRPDFPVLQRVEVALQASNPAITSFQGDTNGDLTSTGARLVKSYGVEGEPQLSLGSDIRYLEQHLAEEFSLPPEPDIETNMPRAEMVDPGLFVETTLPWQPYWDTKIGGRVDWVHTDANTDIGYPEGVRPLSSLPPTDTFDQNDVLYHFYATNDVELTEVWTARFGFGHAQRAPALPERYADGIFLGIIQSGFSRVIGDPELDKERSWQVDLGFEANADYVRFRGTAYHAWIHDYITYSANIVNDPSGARLLLATNTDLATLTGFELSTDVDLTSMITGFATLRYVDGRDREIDQPLPQIAPMESRLGIRLRDPYQDNLWGIEFGSRIVDNQDRLASLRRVGVPGVERLEVETPGFTTFYLRAFANVTENFSLVGGVENMFDRTYLEHLDLRLPEDPVNGFAATQVLAPGITPYLGGEWTY